MGLGIAGEQYRWPNRTVPYEVDPALPDQDRIAEAVAHWHQHSSIRFVPHAGEADYVLVTRVPGCAVSDVGRRGGRQCVSLGDGCSVGSIIHELGHTIGLWHEHCRDDRDRFVTIDFTNIQDDCVDNFTQDSIAGVATPTDDVGDYDYGSIMHYPEIAFPIDDTCPVITPLNPLPPGVVMGQRVALSPGDIAAVEEMYRGMAVPP
jgi:Astacin (Peptidase family M12A)